MTENKTLEQCFFGMKEVEERIKVDPQYDERMKRLAGRALAKVKSKEHIYQHETYQFLKDMGCEDQEILWVYGSIMSTQMLDIIDRVIDLGSAGVADRLKLILKGI